MKVKDIMTKDVITTSSDQTISKTLGSIQRNNVHQLPVVSKNTVIGIITLDDIFKKDADPATTKVAALMHSTPTVLPDDDVEKAIQLILSANQRAIPVVGKELEGIISETDILKIIKIDKTLDEVAKKAHCVEVTDTLGKAKHVMNDNNISKVPVVKNGSCVGIIGTLELIKTLVPGKQSFEGSSSRAYKAHGTKEKRTIDETLVTTLMSPANVYNNSEMTVAQAITLLQKNEQVILKNGELSIITPKDILRATQKPTKFELIQVTGIDKEKDADISKMYAAASAVVQRLSREATLQSMRSNVESIDKGGKRYYEFHIQLPTNVGMFIVSKTKGWDFVSTAQTALGNLEREFEKKHRRTQDQKRTKARSRKNRQ